MIIRYRVAPSSNSNIIRYHVTLIHITRIQSLFGIILHGFGITILKFSHYSVSCISVSLGDTLFEFSHYFVLNYVILLSFHWILSMIEMISEIYNE